MYPLIVFLLMVLMFSTTATAGGVDRLAPKMVAERRSEEASSVPAMVLEEREDYDVPSRQSAFLDQSTRSERVERSEPSLFRSTAIQSGFAGGLVLSTILWEAELRRRIPQLDLNFRTLQRSAETPEFRSPSLTLEKAGSESAEGYPDYTFGHNQKNSGNSLLFGSLLKNVKKWMGYRSDSSSQAQHGYDVRGLTFRDSSSGGRGGVGYRLFDTSRFDLLFQAGSSASWELLSSRENSGQEGLFGGELAWKLSEKKKLSLESCFSSSPTETGSRRSLSPSRWTLKIDQANGGIFTFGIQKGYRSQIDTNTEGGDITYYGTLEFDF